MPKPVVNGQSISDLSPDNLAVEKLRLESQDTKSNENVENLKDLDDLEEIDGIKFVNYRDESDLASVMALVGRDLSEPYSIFTYRYFLNQFPDLCILAVPTRNKNQENKSDGEDRESRIEPIGCVVCKVDEEEVQYEPGMCDGNIGNKVRDNDHVTSDGSCIRIDSITHKPKTMLSGYMAMLAVDTSYRKSGIGTALVKKAVRRMRKMGCSSVTLETEVSNKAAIRLYEDRLGFIREELLVRYYLNWGDAYRLRLWFD